MGESNWTRWELESPPAFEAFPFEDIDINWWYWFAETFWLIPFFATAVYYVGLYLCFCYMKTRPPKDLRTLLFLWNLSIGLFSVVALCRTSPEMFRVLMQPNGFYKSVCQREGLNKPFVFWIFLYAWSKILQFGDTFFLVLRKKRVPFFHVFHHSVACILPMQIVHLGEPIGRWFVMLNYLVHAIVYPYLALKCVRAKIPKLLAHLAVGMELFQMVAGLSLGIYSMKIKESGIPCVRHEYSVKLVNIVYSIFLLLVGKMTLEHVFLRSAEQGPKTIPHLPKRSTLQHNAKSLPSILSLHHRNSYRIGAA